MRMWLPRLRSVRAGHRAALGALVCALAVLSPGALARAAAEQASSPETSTQGAPAQGTHATTLSGKGLAAATLEQCATATAPQSERTATFAGEMTASTLGTRMQMRIELQERASAEARYRTVSAPALDVWQSSNPGVKLFTYIHQVSNLSAPAEYRGAIQFRWLDAKGRLVKDEELHTAGCVQPAPSEVAGSSTTSASST